MILLLLFIIGGHVSSNFRSIDQQQCLVEFWDRSFGNIVRWVIVSWSDVSSVGGK